jgi:excinuclease ABC subunit C
MNWKSLEILQQIIQNSPKKPGVYKMIGELDKVLYIGKAKILPNRLKNYLDTKNLTNRIRQMVFLIQKVEYTVTETEADALILEASLIKSTNPPYNILLKDDKSLPYISISAKNQFPGLEKYRGKKQIGYKYFGPFGATLLAFEAIETASKIFQVRTCSDYEFSIRKRPCLEYQIKRCTAPCVGKVNQADYASQVENLEAFLSGRDNGYLKLLEVKMQDMATNLRFEEASQIRDKIRLIARVQSGDNFTFKDFEDTDIVAVYRQADVVGVQVFFVRNGLSFGAKVFFMRFEDEDTLVAILEAFLMQFYSDNQIPPNILINQDINTLEPIIQALNKLSNKKVDVSYPKRGKKLQLLQFTLPNLHQEVENKLKSKSKTSEILYKIKDIFKLDKIPHRIEVFDNSHFSGTEFMGGMIVATQDGFVKNQYRKFNAKSASIAPGDDFGLMEEVMMRRYRDVLKEAEMPDLVLIDGGKGQQTAVKKAFEKLGLIGKIPFVCISKGPDRNAGREKFHLLGHPEFQLEPEDPVLYYLQQLRDEAHRFVINAGRNKRVKNVSNSALDKIEGIGKIRKQKLLQKYGSAKAVKQVSPDELSRFLKISPDVANKILDNLKNTF